MIFLNKKTGDMCSFFYCGLSWKKKLGKRQFGSDLEFRSEVELSDQNVVLRVCTVYGGRCVDR